MISIIRKTGLLGIVMMLQMNFTGCASMVLGFSAEPITATIVDAETKQPLKDVIVVAHWQLVEGGFLDSSVPAGELMVMETVTDKNGVFHFPEWGPKYEIMGRMKNEDPEIIIFKPGYVFKVLANEWISTEIRDYRALRSSDWDGKTIELEQFEGSDKEYANKLSSMTIYMRYVENNCDWKRTPKIILALTDEQRLLQSKGIDRTLYSVNYLPTNEKVCGSVADYFRKYSQ